MGKILALPKWMISHMSTILHWLIGIRKSLSVRAGAVILGDVETRHPQRMQKVYLHGRFETLINPLGKPNVESVDYSTT